MLIDDLIERYGKDAVLTASPLVIDSGATLHWIAEIDGAAVPDVDVRVDHLQGHPDWRLLTLVGGGDELEIERWSIKHYPHAPASVIRTLAGLRPTLN